MDECLVLSHLVDGLITGVLQTQINHGILERSTHVELQRQVIYTLKHIKTHTHKLNSLSRETAFLYNAF